MSALTFQVFGTPAPQGSKRHVGNGVMVESSAKVKPWREAVKWAARDEHMAACTTSDGVHFSTGGVRVEVTFRLPRPKGHYRTGRNAHLLRDSAPSRPASKPDIDKLLRSTLDAIGEAGVWKDDAQVVEVIAAKAYADDNRPVGAVVTVRAA